MNKTLQKIEIIEMAVVKFGRIITNVQLNELLGGYKNKNDKIHKLLKEGWLVKLRRELYYISKIGSFGFTSISNYQIANLIGEESFVSFEAALKFHGLFDQGIRNYRSISKKQYLQKKNEENVYEYIKIKDKNYFGWNEESVDGGIARIALKERALLDLLEYHRTINSVSLVLESLQNNYDDFSRDWFKNNLQYYSKVTASSFGFLLDLANRDSSYIYSTLIDKKIPTFKMFSNAKKFNKKWRIYYDSILEEQVK